jgi:hypothetical protein
MRDASEWAESVRQTTFVNPAIAAMLLGIALAFSLTGFLQPTLVGDGGEYYAMFFAWKDTARPFMTDASWSALGKLAASGEIAGFVPVEALREEFPELRVGTTADFNHFWLYSALAALVNLAASLLHVTLSTHAAFMLTHWLLFSVAAVLAYRYFQSKGLAAVLVLAILSPMIWYADKVHTEFFTFCLTLSAVIAFAGRNYILSALFLAIASTQNISFAAVAAIPFAIHFLDSGTERHSRSSPASVICAVLACLFILMHPLYYFSRYGVITPQMLAGGAVPGGNLSLFYIWLVDPDVGLLPNWPLGLAILLICPFIGRTAKRSKGRAFLLLFVAAYLSINLIAQSSTQNLNSGATPGLARYALWYIPLFFPLLIYLLDAAKDLRWLRVAVLLVCLVCLLHTQRFNHPQIGQSHLKPSPVSLYLQKNLPALYNPPVEIFAERYGGIGEMPSLTDARAIVGPGCKKILVFSEAGRDRVYGTECAFSEEKVKELIERRFGAVTPQTSPMYVSLGDHEAVAAMLACPRYLDFSAERGFPSSAVKGFSAPEPHGRWTDGGEASFACSLPAEGNRTPTRMRVATTAFLFRGHTRHVSISLNGARPIELEYVAGGETKMLELDISALRAGPIQLRFTLPDAVSPKELGLNIDARKIAISVKSVEFE